MKKLIKVIMCMFITLSMFVACGEKTPKITKEYIAISKEYSDFFATVQLSDSDVKTLKNITLEQDILTKDGKLIETVVTTFDREEIELNDGSLFSEIGWYEDYELTKEEAFACKIKTEIISFDYINE